MITCKFPDGVPVSLRHVCADLLVENDKHQVLLIKRSKNVTRSNKYGIPGGYLDRGEDVPSGALREFEEETGYKAKIDFLFCINDSTDEVGRKDDRQNVIFIFKGEIVSGEMRLNDEVSEITWFDESNLPNEEDFAFDHRRIILAYFTYKKSVCTLPIFSKDL